jgi:RNA polymerase sigma-70 factor (ECF subfamily)
MSREPNNTESLSNAAAWTPLLDRVRAGDEDAARTVVERLYDHVRKVVLAHLPRRDDPEDVMQEVFMKVFSRLGQFSGEVPLENWVTRIALLTCIDRLRRQRARPELRLADLSESEQELVRTVAAETEPPTQAADSARELILKLLEQLKPEEQAIIRWLDLEQKTIAEVSQMTGWNSGLTRIRAFRARQKLKNLYRKLEKQIV